MHKGVIARDAVVETVLDGGRHGVSVRSAQRRFARATGITYAAYRTIERARHATNLLREGVPIIDVVHRAGYFDQPHLTRSLKYLIGQTPFWRSHARRDSCRFYTRRPAAVRSMVSRKEADSMRFMTLIKSAENTNLAPPPPMLFQAIARLGDEAKQAGVLVDTAGLVPTAAGALVRLNAGRDLDERGAVRARSGDRWRVCDLQRRVEAGSDRLGEEIHGAAPGVLEWVKARPKCVG